MAPVRPWDFTIGRLYLSNEPYSPARYETTKYLRGRGAQAAGRLARLPDIKGDVLDSTDIRKLMCTVSLGSAPAIPPGRSDAVVLLKKGLHLQSSSRLLSARSSIPLPGSFSKTGKG